MKRVVLGLVAVIASFCAVPASAGPILVDAGWYGFCFGAAAGSPASPGCLNDGSDTSGNPFTFVATDPVLFKITDAFKYGDVFTVVIDGGTPFQTSPSVMADGSTSDPDIAFADAGYSKASVLLGAGSHSINVFTHVAHPFGGGAYLEVETAAAVPDTGSSLALLGLGMAGLATLRRTRLK